MLKKLSKPIAIAIAMATALALSSCVGGGVSEDQVKQEILQTEMMTEGIIRSDYVESVPYELTNFKVTNQTIDGEGNSHSLVEFEGTISNGVLESTFVACADYYKQGEAWIQSNPQLISVNTVPLKGVDFISKPTEKDAFTVSDFQSTFEESNGSYTSTATQNVTYEFWFATDTAINTAAFEFDNDRGWIMQGDATASDMNTEWKLAGKTFGYTEADDTYRSAPTGDFTTTIAFKAGESTNQFLADYAIDFINDQESYEWFGKEYLYYDVHLNGSAAATLSHVFGEDKFEIQLIDSENTVTMTCTQSKTETVAGIGTVNAMRVDIETAAVYAEVYGKSYFDLSCVCVERQ